MKIQRKNVPTQNNGRSGSIINIKESEFERGKIRQPAESGELLFINYHYQGKFS